MSSKKDTLEDILKDFLDRILVLRFDICTCQRCKKEMMEYLLTKFRPLYESLNNSCDKGIEDDFVKNHLKDIFIEIKNAIDIVNKNLPHPLEIDREKEFNILLEKIREERGVDFSQYFRDFLKRRIALRLKANEVKSYSEYLKILANNPDEYEKLFEVLTINVSEFFRDYSVWLVIKRILTNIIMEKNLKEEPIRIWSAGCAKGEEPYSLAILAKEINNIKVPFKIYATDIDKDSLEHAKKGAYESLQIEKTTKNILKRYLLLNLKNYFIFKEGNYYIKDEIKDLIEFRYLDLTSSDYISGVDMILCRNVFIYFTKPLQEQILNNFYRSLKKNGYLIIGKSETLVLGARLVFKEIDNYNRIYQKIKI
jgi:chemotaxis methyl-accepting protein methylase